MQQHDPRLALCILPRPSSAAVLTSMQTLSMLCASSNTTMHSLSSSFETILDTFGSIMYCRRHVIRNQ